MVANILIEKLWQEHENDILELKIKCSSEYAVAIQTCYIGKSDLADICFRIKDCIEHLDQNCYLEFGKKDGNYTPAFSMNIEEIDPLGHVKIEVDVEINDNPVRKHRSCFYVRSELGLLEKFALSLNSLIDGAIGFVATLNSSEENDICR